MRFPIFLLILLSIISLCLTSKEGPLKTAYLRSLALQTSDGIFTLNATGYEYYVLQNPRPYDLVIFYTAGDCKLCDQIYETFETAAKMYKQANAHYAVKSENEKKRAVFFAKIKFSAETRDVFINLKFNSVPNLIITQPKLAQIDETQKSLYLRDFTWQISMSDGQVTASKILEFINKKTQRNVEFKEPIANMFIFLGFLIFIGFLGYKIFFAFKSFFLNQKVWFIGSLLIYVICMAGVVYNILHDVPFTNIDRNGNFEWMHSGSRSQFGAEGFIMSFVFAFIGVLLILLSKYSKFSDDRTKVTALSLISIFIVYMLVGFVEETYKKKSWYGPQYWPPDNYVQGPLMKDQGNTV